MPLPCATASRRRAQRSRARGFTLIELVAAIVIVGALVAIALPIFRDLRYDARKASLDSVRATVAANATLARTAWLAQGGGATVQVNGRTVAVYPSETVIGGSIYPAGAPTASGMYAMLGCSATPFVPSATPVPCAALSGYVVAGANDDYLAIWSAATASSFNDAWCALGYWPPYGHDDSLPLGPSPTDPEFNVYAYVEAWTRPVATQPGGC